MSMPKGLFELIRTRAREDIAELPIVQVETYMTEEHFQKVYRRVGAGQLNARDESRGVKRKKSDA